jgi:hypothetical protein
MIRKFISIKNVGRFLSYGASKDVELKRYSLASAGNGTAAVTSRASQGVALTGLILRHFLIREPLV